jgi:hypothetical protein
VQTARLDKNLNCPDGMTRCSPFTSANNTICTVDKDDCPVTYLSFKAWRDLDKFNFDASGSADKGPLYEVQGFNEFNAIVTSKQVDSLPITSTRIDHNPCMDPTIQTTRGIYQLEIQRYTQCPIEENSGLNFDSRY